MKTYVTATLCLLFFQPGALACESHDSRGVVSKQTVRLQTKVQEGSFYYRLGQYAVFSDRDRFTAAVENGIKAHGHRADTRLLQEIRSLPTTKAHNDAFAMAINDPTLLVRIERYLGELLQRGEATVVDVYEFPADQGRVVPVLTVVTSETDNWKGRHFCTPSGKVLLEITDVIV